MPSPNTLALRERLSNLRHTVEVIWHQSGTRYRRHGQRRGLVGAQSYVNPEKDRSLRGKARRRARKAAR